MFWRIRGNSPSTAGKSRGIMEKTAGERQAFAMAAFLTGAEEILYEVVQLCTMLMELFGVCVLVYTAVKTFIKWIRRAPGLRLDLAQGIALALEFKMGGEVLRTVVVREWQELGILGAIILLRGVLTFLIHWEIRNEKEDMEKEKK